jgi:hypothetical protein
MAGWTIPLGAAPSVGPAMFRDADTAVFIATTDGAVLSCRLLDGAVRKHGSGHTAPIAALPAPDGLGIYVVEAAGRILEVYREEADAAQAVLVADLQQTVIAARLDARGAALFAVGEGTVEACIALILPPVRHRSSLQTLAPSTRRSKISWWMTRMIVSCCSEAAPGARISSSPISLP